jgi:predicted SPOUT superfamily RNA methylase MTH1
MTRTVCVPSSLVREAEDQREATRKLGYVARAAAVFRADRLVVFPDREGESRWGEEFVVTVLEYAATPPYLKQEAWGKRDELRYVGVLPPLGVLPQTSAENGSAEIRQGIVTEVGPEGRVRVNCGLQHPISLLVPADVAVEKGERVTIRISSREPVRARIVDEPAPGFVVERADLPEALARDDAGVRIATSRYGRELTVARLRDLVGRIEAGGLTAVFGSPGRGLPEILGVDAETIAAAGGEPVEPDPGFDLWLNTIPRQGSEVVRTEEAMFASLGCLTLTE